MSAYIVERDHVTYLVQAGRDLREFGWFHGGTRHKLTDPERNPGQMLWDENIASVRYRYSDSYASADALPGPIGETFEYDEPAPTYWADFKPGQVFAALSCFEYQSCEHPGWEESEAHAYCEALRREYCRKASGGTLWGAPPRNCERLSMLGVVQS